ncbi:MAG: sulfurtransferase TusA family protein [Alphaproteobacteria bacterium]|nr:sulfurtransferase TusA family protein [Rhodospirillales bacterium]MCW9045815.1 sulfurtransferase TusA family protein [Alphaproteobacteria bacterium]
MTVELDAKGLTCPMPILKAKKAIKGMGGGEMLKIESTDAGSVADFESFCRNGGHELMESNEDGGVYTFLIKKSA